MSFLKQKTKKNKKFKRAINNHKLTSKLQFYYVYQYLRLNQLNQIDYIFIEYNRCIYKMVK